VKVSVIICTYNYARFLPQCLESVLSQTRTPDEIIVVDDGSTDETPEVVKRYEGIRYIRQDHAGKVVAFNKGLEVTTGDIICHLDADDYWFERKVERLIDIFSCYPSAGGIIHDAVIIHEDEAPPKELPPNGFPQMLDLEKAILSAFVYLPSKYRNLSNRYFKGWSITPFAGGITVRREIIQQYLPLPKSINLSTDGFLWFVSAIHGLVYLPEVLCVYRHHKGSYWGGNPQAMAEQIELYRWLIHHPYFSKHLSPKGRRLFVAKLIEDALIYELNGGPRNSFSFRTILIFYLLSVGILPGWKHWAMGLAFPIAKIARQVIHHLKGRA
jgi:glycosyltransferase involved in cell wall biosynthesis